MVKETLNRAAGQAPGAAGGGPAPGFLRPGRRIYAVGDPHGCLGTLQALHALIAADLAARPAPEPLLVHLGDYIDRGPDSAGILELLSRGDPIPGVPTVNLLGNHESMMLDALAGRGSPGLWQENGGDKALESWGVTASARPSEWEAAIPAAHLSFLRALKRQHVAGGYVFVHAGLRPGVEMAVQTDTDRIWIREPFLSARVPVVVDRPDLVVVHGHTPARVPAVTAARIGVDTGAVAGGKLTAAVLEADRVRFLQA